MRERWIVKVWTTGRIEVLDNNYSICEIHPMHNDKHKANAWLIAAAPELLDALKEEHLRGHGADPHRQCTVCKLIAKAEGK